MKKIVATICLLCYTASAIGLSLSFSFCNNELTGVVFSKTENKNRCCCGDEVENECCELTTISAKTTNEHYRFGLAYALKKVDNTRPSAYLPLQNSPFSYTQYSLENTTLLRPPAIVTAQAPLYIVHSVLLI